LFKGIPGGEPLGFEWKSSYHNEKAVDFHEGVPVSAARELLETFANTYPQRDYLIEIVAPEFTSVCPITGQPDFGTLTLRYVADKLCVELKSWKMYLQSYRNQGIFYENVTNVILDDLVSKLQPRKMTLIAAFTPRGGISSVITCEHSAEHTKTIKGF
jgi:7-cyano-7-deazaguanine reductase